ncbi:efflux transporter outer membrane subunit [Gynurincola endophyticus]|uniref:efflux transporter outer membrane subunit n=1 Tax=Gynurincola endophyticus TaxID=2479004 RepID=UPI000F8DE2F8|nr:efflux transporter outer membrane subunit [Gynurincola endophyticus]
MIKKRIYQYITGFFLLLALWGCKVGKPYQTPPLTFPENFRVPETMELGEDSVQLQLVNWRQFFKDSSLLLLIDQSLNYNFDLLTTLKNIDIANKTLKQANAAFLPSMDIGLANINRQWRSDDFMSTAASKYYERYNGGNPPENWYILTSQYGTDLRFSWEIDIWGKLRSGREEALARWFSTQEAKRVLETNLVANVAKGYFNLMMLDAQREVAQKNLQLNDSTLRIIRLQFDAGEITALAIQQTESQRLIAASLIPELEQKIAIQENALRLLVGQLPDTVYRNSDIDSVLIQNEYITLGTPIEVVRNRPDIRQAEWSLRAANANANVQQAMRYPNLTLGAAFGTNSMFAENWFNLPGAILGGFTAGLTQPVFQNRRLKTRYEIALLERDKAEISFNRSVYTAVSEISNALTSIEKQKLQLDLTEQRVITAALAVKNAGLLFKSGYATYLEVITAQSNALRSELDLVALKQKQLEAIVDLYRAVGGGWNQ